MAAIGKGVKGKRGITKGASGFPSKTMTSKAANGGKITKGMGKPGKVKGANRTIKGSGY